MIAIFNKGKKLIEIVNTLLVAMIFKNDMDSCRVQPMITIPLILISPCCLTL